MTDLFRKCWKQNLTSAPVYKLIYITVRYSVALWRSASHKNKYWHAKKGNDMSDDRKNPAEK
jgi:hypothetical protein